MRKGHNNNNPGVHVMTCRRFRHYKRVGRCDLALESRDKLATALYMLFASAETRSGRTGHEVMQEDMLSHCDRCPS
jgi:hypothetical protein